jgi:hypothetical protein
MIHRSEVCKLMGEEQTKGYKFGTEREEGENLVYSFRTCAEAVMGIIQES